MKKILHIISLLLCFVSTVIPSQAKQAKKGILNVETPDGSTLKVKLVGNEFWHHYYTEDDFPLCEKSDGFYYCDYDASGNRIDSNIKAVDISDRNTEAVVFLNKIDKKNIETRVAAYLERNLKVKKQTSGSSPYPSGFGLVSDLRFPAFGRQKALVILVEYRDSKFGSDYDVKDYFTRMLNEDGFSDLGATGSAAQYFKENSQYSFIPEFDVYGPVTLPENRAYYGANDRYGDDLRPGEMVRDACELLDDVIDFSEYDRDKDGIVDNVYIFYAGKGEASGGPSYSIWPHSWDMESAGFPDLYYDNVKIHNYACSNEIEDGRPDGIGTFVHEFSHVLGLPDLYAYNSNCFTPGEWSVIDYGNYNNNSRTPPNFSAFERYALGWIKPREINKAVSASLEPIHENVCGIIRTDKETEFYLLENRQQEGWDKYIPGHGMLIWHIDYNKYLWDMNQVNQTSYHQCVDLVEADDIPSSDTRSGDPFPGTSNITSFTSKTSPALFSWESNVTDYELTDIVEEEGLITFNILGGGSEFIQSIYLNEADMVDESSFHISWDNVPDSYDVLLNVYTIDEGKTVYHPGFKNRNMMQKADVNITGLQPSTSYYVSIALTDGWNTSEYSDPKTVTTSEYMSGVEVPVVSDEAPTVYYDLTGKRILNPAPGIYIVRKGCETSKVIIK